VFARADEPAEREVDDLDAVKARVRGRVAEAALD
jgi:hypothetical protein